MQAMEAASQEVYLWNPHRTLGRETGLSSD
jgi:hypothetical protein